MSAVFHRYNKETQREHKIPVEKQTLPFCAKPTCFGKKIYKALTFRQHLESLGKKLTTRFWLMRQLAGSGWDTSGTVLGKPAFVFVHSAAEYCTPV